MRRFHAKAQSYKRRRKETQAALCGLVFNFAPLREKLCLVLLLFTVILSAFPPPAKLQSLPPYKNPNLPIDVRVNDLVSRMTLEEKVSQMMNGAPAIERLGVPAYDWWNEALHGVARAGYATVFPQAIGLAATWDTNLMHDVADVISTEARAKHHEFLRNNQHARYQGLTFWSPNINIFRDPRWGRGQETYGEDPYLTASLVSSSLRDYKAMTRAISKLSRRRSTMQCTVARNPSVTASTRKLTKEICAKHTCPPFAPRSSKAKAVFGHVRLQPHERRTCCTNKTVDDGHSARRVGL